MSSIEPSEPIAIVGIGGVFPGSPNISAYWENILAGRDCVIEVPADRWDWKLYYDPDPSAPDKTYSKIGGFVRDFKFDPLALRIPPPVAAQMDMVQQLAVAATGEALRDSGYQNKPHNPERTAVVLGNSMGGTKKEATDLRVYASLYKHRLAGVPAFAKLPTGTQSAILTDLEQRIKSGLSTITEDTMPGELSNVIAGRVANAFNFNGANFTVDAACASSLAALDQAIKGLRFHEYDMVLCGGVDQMMSPPAYVKFCKIGALSPDGSRPFDAGANGFVMGEGVGVGVLKRLRDAVKDGDKIYALIRAVGSSSDGRGKGITAPNPKGQRLAIERAFKQLDYTPAGVGLLEAHGTSTKVGDVVEVNEASEIFRAYCGKSTVALGSVKSQIGHLKAAAGVASLIKAALAIRHKTLPPSINFKKPNPGIDWQNSPFSVLTQAREWHGSAQPRRANVSSFGFGGTNFHVALEEPTDEAIGRWLRSTAKQSLPQAGAAQARAATPAEVTGAATAAVTVAADQLPRSLLNLAPRAGEVFMVHGETPEAVFDRLEAVKNKSLSTALHQLAAEVNSHRRGDFRLALAAESGEKLAEKIELILKARNEKLWENPPAALRPRGIYLGRAKNKGKIGLLFPGQGSQYVDMMKDLCSRFAVVAETFAEADAVLKDLIGSPLTEILFTRGGESAEALERMEERIKQTEITQPAVLTADVAILRLLQSCGVKADVVCGHSLGEYAALVAAGILDFKDALLAVSARAKEMAGVRVTDPGKMASVAAPIAKIEPVLKEVKGYVAPANKNCPSQTVIAGESAAVDAAVKKFDSLGIQAQLIAVSHAFHSRIVEPAQKPYRKFLDRVPVNAPRVPILSNVTAAYYPEDPAQIRDLLVAQIASPVEFIRQVERMYKDGVRLFVEAGPKRVLTAFVTSTLEDKKDALAMSSNHPKRGGLLEFHDLLARLDAEGIEINLPKQHPTRVAQQEPALPLPIAGEGRGESSRNGWDFYTGSVVVSGIAAGTPGAWDRVFKEDSLDQILRGQNLIGKLDARDIDAQIEKNIVRVVKSATGDHRLERIENAAEVVKLAALAGEFDLAKEFGFKESIANAMDVSSRLAVAAGIVALRDAGIPLVATHKTTTTGSSLPTGWALPPSLRDETGIIFASAFPSIESMASEVARYLADKFRRKPLRQLAALLDSLVAKIKDPQTRAAVEHWYATNFRPYQERFGSEGPYEFSREFLLRIMPLGHSQLAQWIGARGPAVHVSAACASTTQAVGMAEDWLRLGRAKRVIVIAGDDVTSPSLREWLTTSFLAAGAATTSGVVSEAALPFDRRRHGMILGMGAIGLVIEHGSLVEERGMRPLTQILATQFENSAFHITRLHVEHVADVLGRLLTKAEKRYGLKRGDIAARALFVSHETYTPARGGSASAEVHALKQTFGADSAKIVVTNTKGFTGHSMGASIEDPIAVRALVTGQVPPIANYKEADPDLSGIQLSRGGEYDLEYAIRLGAGFGSQIAMSLMQRVLRKGENRIGDPARHAAWLTRVCGHAHPQLEVVNNTLRVKEGARVAQPAPLPAGVAPAHAPVTPAATQTKPVLAPAANAHRTGVSEEQVKSKVLAVVGEKTGYPQEMLELDLDMEADLGIDTVKQAELFGLIRESYGIERKENLSLKDYPTLRHVIRFVLDSTGRAAVPAEIGDSDRSRLGSVTVTDLAAPADDEVRKTVLALVAEKTGYPQEMLELDLDMEADLGIDTVKQAELIGVIRERYHIPRKENLSLKDYPTLRHVIGFVMDSRGARPNATATNGVRLPAAPPREAAAQQSLRKAGAAPAVQPAAFRRWVARWQSAPLHAASAPKMTGSALIVARTAARAEPFKKALEKAGAATSVLALSKAQTMEQFGAAVEKIFKGKRPLGLLWLGPFELEPQKSFARFNEDYQLCARNLFIAAKALRQDLARSGAWLAVATRAHDAPIGGAARGLAKGLSKEIEGLRVVAIDFARAVKPADAAQRLIEELAASETEVRYASHGRQVLRLAAETVGAPARLKPGAVVLFTGGGQGVGAECAKELARRHQPRLFIVGRTPLEAKAAEWSALDNSGLEALKKQMWERLKSDKSKKATPAILEREFSSVAKAIQLHSNLEAMRAAGSKVVYLTADLADAKQVKQALAKLPAPDFVFHAAGLEESKLLADKEPERFDAVFKSKAHGARNLLECVQGKADQRWVFFSSVVGRFGNIGQCDYAAASDFLATLSEWLQANGKASAAIDLTAIADVGMATRGGVELFLKSQGVDFMPPKVCVEMILAEALGAMKDPEVLFAGSLGKLDARGQMDSVAAHKPAADFTGKALVTRKFSLESDSWLADHAIAGTPYVAGVMGLELFAQAARQATKNEARAFEDVQFALPIKLLRDKPIDVRAYYENGALRIESDFVTPQGIKLGAPRVHFTARSVSSVSPIAESQDAKLDASWGSGKDVTPNFTVTPPQIYSAYFHGPSFQVLAGMTNVTEKEIVAVYAQPQKPLWKERRELLFIPMLIEAAFQACGYRDLHFAKKMTLPDSIGRVDIHPRGAAPARLLVRCSYKGQDPAGKSVYDAIVADNNGRIWVALTDYKMVPVS